MNGTTNGNMHFAAAAALQKHQLVLDTGARVTEIVGRMLQCVSVLASVQSGDDAQAAMERLTKMLKWNWLGRGRTGRQRRGFCRHQGSELAAEVALVPLVVEGKLRLADERLLLGRG